MRFRPHLPWRFKVTFFAGGDLSEPAKLMTYAVSSVKVSGVDVDTSAAAMHFGTGYYTIPIIDPSRTLDITFEETDSMDVIKFIDEIVAMQRNGLPYVLGIGISEFDERMKTPLRSQFYSCVLANYEEPSFSRSGGVQQVTLNCTFNIMSEKPWDGLTSAAAIGKQTPDAGLNDNLVADLTEAAQKTDPSNVPLVPQEWRDQFEKDLLAGREKKEKEKKEKEEKKKEKREGGSSSSSSSGGGSGSGSVPGAGKDIPAKAPKTKVDNKGDGVASVWNSFRWNAIDEKKAGTGQNKLQNLMHNDKSWITMAFRDEKSVGDMKKTLMKEYGLTAADFKDPAALMEAMQRAEDRNVKNGGAAGSVWGSTYGCSGATAWATWMTSENDSFVMPQDMLTAGGTATGDLQIVAASKNSNLYSSSETMKFSSKEKAEEWIREHAVRGDNIGISDSAGHGHEVIKLGGAGESGFSSDHMQKNAIPGTYSGQYTITIRHRKK